MKNKINFSLSGALIRENYKMYWYLPVLSFIAYFMAGIFPLLMDPAKLTDPNHWYLEDCLQNFNIAFVCLLVAAPLVGAVVMMNYLHNPARAMTIHAQPFSRGKIFWSHILSGWTMCILPPAAMTLIYLVISGQPGHSLHFGASSLAILTFFYGTFVLAGALVGTSVMHVLLCGIFFGIIPLVLWLTWMYCENFLTGFYEVPDWMADFLFDTNPLLWMLSEGGEWFNPGRILAYLAAGLVFTLIAAVLTNRARLEHVGDSMLFRAAEEIITWLVVFVGMSAFGFFFCAVLDTRAMTLVGMAVGSLLAFAVVKIVLDRTIRIVTKQNLYSLGAFALIAVIFSGCTMYDLTGYTQRVPDASKVVSVQRSTFGYGDTFDYYYNNIEEELTEHQEYLTSPQAIEKVIALHENIVENKLYDYDTADVGTLVYDEEGREVYQGNFWITFRYTLENGSQMSRRFDFQLTEESASLMNAIITDEEYKDDGRLLDIFTTENISYIELSVYDYSFEYEEKFQNGTVSDMEYDAAYRNAQATLLLKDPDDIEAFLAAMETDHENRRYTVDASGVVDRTEDLSMLNYMDISGTIYLKPGTDGVYSPQNDTGVITDTAPDNGSKTIGKAHFNIRRGHEETLSFLEELLREEGYETHADHIAAQ